jgi:hypothetical protein
MGERDAFGRKIGEDSLSSLGWTSRGADASPTAAAPDPGVAPTPSPTPRRSAPRRRVRSGSSGLRVGVSLFAIAVTLAIVGATVGIVQSVSDHVRDATKIITDGSPSNPTRAAPSPGPQGRNVSLLHPRTLALALRRVRRQAGGRLYNLRVAPDRVDAQVVLPGGRIRAVQVTRGGSVAVFSTTGSGFSGLRTIPWSRIDPRAPGRIARAMRRFGRSRFNYAVFLDAAGLRWSAFNVAGTAFLTGPDGRHLRRNG